MQVLTTAFGGTAQPVPGSGSDRARRRPAAAGTRSRRSSWPVTIWYLEDGFETVVPTDKRARYTGREPNRQLSSRSLPKLRSACAVPDQASQLKDALELAYCQPAVGAFFNFQFVDEVGLGGWQSGLLWADGTPKPSYEPVKTLSRRSLPGRSTARGSPSPRPAPARRSASRAPAGLPPSILAGVLRAVVFDVDFTLARPGPDLGPDGYRQLGLRYGLDLDPARYEQARAAAFTEVKRHPELDHDEEIWVLFTERIIAGMGGAGDTYAAAVEMERRWAQSAHFELYDDALPVLDALRERGLKIGLLSNSSRDLDEFVAHHGLAADAVLTSHAHGKTKPHGTIFRAHARPARGRAGRGGDGGRHDRGRRRGRARGRDAGGAARSRGAVSRVRGTARRPARAARGARAF